MSGECVVGVLRSFWGLLHVIGLPNAAPDCVVLGSIFIGLGMVPPATGIMVAKKKHGKIYWEHFWSTKRKNYEKKEMKNENGG